MIPDATIVITSYGGAERLPRCISSIDRQTIRARLEVIVVDDGSTDDTAVVAERLGARVISHGRNRGIAAARNSGLGAAETELVILLDDDCEAEPEWAAAMLNQAQRDDVSVVGGELVIVPNDRGFCGGYLQRNNPFKPVEASLLQSDGALFRLREYLGANWRPTTLTGPRVVFSVAGGNACFRRSQVREAGHFTEGAPAAEETELCLRLRDIFPACHVVYQPAARVVHYTETGFRTLMRRSRQYGRGNAFLMRARGSRRPTIFPAPLLVGGVVVGAVFAPTALLLAILLPPLFFPAGVRTALRTRRAAPLVDPYVRLAIEAAGNVGFVEQLIRGRA